MNEANRPSPDALLAEAKQEQRGRLKVFLGAAPGVGKTYAMLGAAQTRVAEGVDAVIGIVETHRRQETENLAEGIEIIPRQKIDYRGLPFEEMDLDAILRRKPALVLVDELAHTNVPGVRHAKRYQDVQELLENGIDVYTTLNVQHIESLNDIVTRITGVTVRETVPDSIVRNAQAIELIDLPPEELLQRLKNGKVYIPEQARLAVNRFFSPGNLTALRELALRQAADRVDEQMTSYMRRHAITGPWPTSNRVMVCVSDDGQAAALVRAAQRNAERRQAPWLVLYIETSRHRLMSAAARNDIAQAMQIATHMGAETLTTANEDAAVEILRVAREHNVTTIVIGKTLRSALSRAFRPSVSSAVIEQADGFDVLLVNNRETLRPPPGSESRKLQGAPEKKPLRVLWPSYATAGLVMICATLIVWGLQFLGLAAFFPFLYMITFLGIVVDFGVGPSLFAILVSAVTFDALLTAGTPFLIPQRQEDWQLLILVPLFGFFVTLIGERLHRRIAILRTNAERTQSLYDFTKSVAAAANITDIAQATVRRIATALGVRTLLLLPHHERLETAAAVPADLRLDVASAAAMDWVWTHKKPAGWRSETLPSASFYGLPLQSGGKMIGVLALRAEDQGSLSLEQERFLASLAAQAATSIERAQLVTDITQARLQTEAEKLRTSLLSSTSRNLREPLDAILQALGRLKQDAPDSSPEIRHQQLDLLTSEAHRLDRFIENFLDMTEIVTGNIRLTVQPVALKPLIEEALGRLGAVTKGKTIQFDCPDDLPLLSGDPKALRSVFVNLIENACLYAPASEPITLKAERRGTSVRVTLTDRGIGIPEAERERVFDMFYRIKQGAADSASGRGAGGTGLGLSICRGFVEAHHGRIFARAGTDGIGTSITVVLPIEKSSA